MSKKIKKAKKKQMNYKETLRQKHKKLMGSKFRMLNEMLYTRSSQEMKKNALWTLSNICAEKDFTYKNEVVQRC